MRSVPQMTDGEGCLLGFVSRATLPPMSALLTALDAFLQGFQDGPFEAAFPCP